MTILQLPNNVNQEFDFVGDGVLFSIRLHYWDELMFASISLDGEKVIDSVRCIGGKWLLPYEYMMKSGNLRFECIDPSLYPNAADFGMSCNLVYYTKEEYEAMKSNVQ